MVHGCQEFINIAVPLLSPATQHHENDSGFVFEETVAVNEATGAASHKIFRGRCNPCDGCYPNLVPPGRLLELKDNWRTVRVWMGDDTQSP
eukprot:CAMPEP_0195012900 /NCGR_PEP_ID=MMETSP0326_2-20130528/12192_1 /TAXON_ID=2866 ORGANISM="Crypthecodinium cohnii, Strain Seligo" /NCGR_SAMPLE_ID=MMETSP0326_2 /ASSEMBLY_ACC=CAM_ASM_000348 /LENGTH=90 /DNA_ID=CAMNT_0040022737 /DNA_START=42 /DNA_END=314 /DNA_ORIENTATION=+